jgi:hypothetical protein
MEGQNKEESRISFVKLSGEFNVELMSMRKALETWQDVGLDKLTEEMDTQATKVTELKTEYIRRRKALAAKVKQFMKTHLPADSKEGFTAMQSDMQDVVDTFKEEFDRLGFMNRYSEAAFLGVYKTMRNANDPVVVMEGAIKLCVSAKDALTRAEALLGEDLGVSSPTPAVDPMDIERIEAAASEQLLAAEAELRTQYIMRERQRENELRSIFERDKLEIQSQMDRKLARKEQELSQVMATLAEQQQQHGLGKEQSVLLETEMEKRREIEEQVRSLMSDLTECRARLQQAEAKNEEFATKETTAKTELDLCKATAAKREVRLTEELKKLRTSLQAAEEELERRPPLSLDSFVEKVGLMLRRSSEMAEQRRTDSNDKGKRRQSEPKPISLKHNSWEEIEGIIVDSILRSSSAATEAHLKQREAVRALEEASVETASLRLALSQQQQMVQSLENDLLGAQKAAEVNAAALRLIQGETPTGRMEPIPAERTMDSLIDLIDSKQSELPSIGSPVPRPNKGMSLGSVSLSDNGLDPTPVKLSPSVPIASDPTGNQMLLQTMQSQRDRLLRKVKEQDGLNSSMRSQVDRLIGDAARLKDDNLELYRRLRLARAAVRSGGGVGSIGIGAHSTSGSSSTSGASKDRARRRGSANNGSGRSSPTRGSEGPHSDSDLEAAFEGLDDIDARYVPVYESTVEVLAEADRESVIAKWSFIERGLIRLARVMFADTYTRLILVVYLLIVHIFAAASMIAVLNPTYLNDALSSPLLDLDKTEKQSIV